MRRQINTLAAAVAATLVSPAALAQVDTSDWNCEYCPFEKDYRAEYSIGVSTVQGEDGYRYGNGSGYDDEGEYAELSGEGRFVGESTQASWTLDDLGLDSRSVGFSFGKPGTYEISLGYDETPYRRFDSTSTVYSGSGDSLSRPASWTPAGTTSGLTDLATSLQPVEIFNDRSRFEFGTAYLPTKNVSLHAGFRRQQRDGVKIVSAGSFTQAAFLPRVLDDYTDEISAGVSFKAGAFDLSLGYFGSYYRNEMDSLTWDNLFTPAPGADAFRRALEPDSDFQQFSLAGVYRTDALNTVVAFSAAFGQGEQNANLLPYTINSSLPATPLPVASLDGQVDTSNYAFTLTSNPFSKARIKLSYRFDERDNQTPAYTWTRVITDTFVTNDGEQNVPYSYDRSRLNISGSYRLFDTVSVSAGYDRTEYDREFQEVASQTEDTGWGQLRWKPTSYLEATFKGGESTREVDEYDTDVAISLGQNPLMRKYYLAHRYREFAEVSLSASLPEKPLSVGMAFLYADDSYSKSELGMTESEEQRFTFDVSWAFSDRSSLYLTAGNESIDAVQLGSEAFAGPVWEASHDDDFDHVGGGIRLSGLGEKVDLTLDYSHSQGETEILYSGMAVAAEPLPELESTLDALRLSLDYQWSEKLRLSFVLRSESFETDDWALDGVLTDSIPNVLTMGATSYDYDVWAFGVSFRYLTGAD